MLCQGINPRLKSDAHLSGLAGVCKRPCAPPGLRLRRHFVRRTENLIFE